MCGPMEKNKQLRNKSLHLGQMTIDKDVKIIRWGMDSLSSANGIGKTTYPHAEK